MTNNKKLNGKTICEITALLLLILLYLASVFIFPKY